MISSESGASSACFQSKFFEILPGFIETGLISRVGRIGSQSQIRHSPRGVSAGIVSLHADASKPGLFQPGISRLAS